jgi:hypothetical protein
MKVVPIFLALILALPVGASSQAVFVRTQSEREVMSVLDGKT